MKDNSQVDTSTMANTPPSTGVKDHGGKIYRRHRKFYTMPRMKHPSMDSGINSPDPDEEMKTALGQSDDETITCNEFDPSLTIRKREGLLETQPVEQQDEGKTAFAQSTDDTYNAFDPSQTNSNSDRVLKTSVIDRQDKELDPQSCNHNDDDNDDARSNSYAYVTSPVERQHKGRDHKNDHEGKDYNDDIKSKSYAYVTSSVEWQDQELKHNKDSNDYEKVNARSSSYDYVISPVKRQDKILYRKNDHEDKDNDADASSNSYASVNGSAKNYAESTASEESHSYCFVEGSIDNDAVDDAVMGFITAGEDGQKYCQKCKDGVFNLATHYCRNCRANICYHCLEQHEYWIKDHHVISLMTRS